MTWETYTRDFGRVFPRGSTIRPHRGQGDGGSGIAIEIPCTGDHTVTETYEKRLPSDKIRSHLSNKGWLFKGNKATCPDCMAAPKEQEKTTVSENASAPKPGATTSDTARRAKREAMAWIDEAFDVEKGRYKGDVSDTTIAKETGLSEQAVAALHATLADRKKALHGAGPDFHGGTSHGKKVWGRECRKYYERHGQPARKLSDPDQPHLLPDRIAGRLSDGDISFPFKGESDGTV